MDFRDSTDKNAILARVDSMVKLNGDTCIGEALDYFYENMFTAAAGSRANVQKRVIVMTDGMLTQITFNSSRGMWLIPAMSAETTHGQELTANHNIAFDHLRWSDWLRTGLEFHF